jgi:hypothetical protein
VPAHTESTLNDMRAAGQPLPSSVRAVFEPRFGYDFGSVRTHAGPDAAGAAVALGARAFTIDNHIYFGAGEYQPHSAPGQRLLAHELTHTIQQTPHTARTTRIQRDFFPDPKAAALAKVNEWANALPPYELLTVLLGRNPITDKPVERNARNILKAALRLVPDGDAIFQDLEKNKSIEKTAAWFDAEITKLNLSWEGVKALFREAWDSLALTDFLSPSKAWEKIKNIFGPTLKRIGAFAAAVGGKILEVIKKAVLEKLGAWAKEQRGYLLLTFVLGKDPVTGEAVPRTPKTFVKAVLDLVPGGDTIYQNLEKARTIEKTVAWLEGEITRLDLSWEKIKELFRKAWDAFSVTDLLNPLALIVKIAGIFAPPVKRILSFALAVGKKVLEFIFEGAMIIAGPIGIQIVGIVRKIGDTFNKIVDDPVGFVGNLVKAVKLGFQQFAKNIWSHLKTGLIEWLVGGLEGAGLELPKVWDLKGILSLVLQILGISYAKIRVKLVKVLGEKTVGRLETVFQFLKVLVTEGPVAAWKQIVEAIGSLWDMVIGGIKDWAISKIVTAAVTKLLTMFNPAGAIIQAIIATYNTVAFFIERIKQILALVEAIVDSIAAIAAGKLAQAANFVERSMARTIPVILGFLARLVGLGDVSTAVKNVITTIQAKVDKGIDIVINFIVTKAKALFGTDKPGAADPKAAGKDEDPKWVAGVAGVSAEIEQMEGAGGLGAEDLQKAIPAWKQKYGFSALEVNDTDAGWDVQGAMSAKRGVKVIGFNKIDYVSQLTSSGQARSVSAVPIRRTSYSSPSDELVGWNRLDHNFWVRGHLLHGKSSGPGLRWNMVPIPKTVNAEMYRDHEKEMHLMLGKRPRPAIWFQADVTYWGSGECREPHEFGKYIKVQMGEAKVGKSGKWIRDKGRDPIGYSVRIPEKARDLVAPKY